MLIIIMSVLILPDLCQVLFRRVQCPSRQIGDHGLGHSHYTGCCKGTAADPYYYCHFISRKPPNSCVY